MQKYFPYSQIINDVCTNIRKSIGKPSFINDWYISRTKPTAEASGPSDTISELYY